MTALEDRARAPPPTADPLRVAPPRPRDLRRQRPPTAARCALAPPLPPPHEQNTPPKTIKTTTSLNRAPAPTRRPAQATVCSAVTTTTAATTPSASVSSRRAALLAAGLLPAAALAALAPKPALAQTNALCTESESEDAAADCRRAALAKEKLVNYGDASTRAATEERLAPNVPVAKLDSKYARETASISSLISAYVAIPADDARARAPLVKPLRAECQKWASAYARGGSARSQSARSMYVAVDAVMGHLASNGIAPLPGAKLREVGASLEASAAFLAEGK